MTLVLFIAMPRVYRKKIVGCETQGELATLFGVTEHTISEWKTHPGFKEDVMRIQLDFFRERTGDVVLAMENEAIKGSSQAARLILEATGYLKKEDKPVDNVPVLLAEAINKISKIL